MSSQMNSNPFIDEAKIQQLVHSRTSIDKQAFHALMAKALELQGLTMEEIAQILWIDEPEMEDELFETARTIKEQIYGKRLVLFAPLYISNLCMNECVYCAFRAKNTSVQRRCLTQEEIARETKLLLDQGHKRILLVAGESYPQQGFSYILDSCTTIYGVTSNTGQIRRINVNIAPLTIEEFKELKNCHIGTYQIFQETYHRETYNAMHLNGRKKDYQWRIEAPDRAMYAGIDDVGIGVLFGLYDWRFEILALLQHIKHLEEKFNVGPHTISVPRLEPAYGSSLSVNPPHAVTDKDFKKIVALLRLSVPYTGIIMSTRETAQMRRDSFALGVSQLSAGSRTNPGGYSLDDLQEDSSQFSIGDHRPLDEIILDITSMGYIPSFCTGCYRLQRTGHDFMEMAKPGDIKHYCSPNAVTTFLEYLLDYASEETKRKGLQLIEHTLSTMEPSSKVQTEKLITLIKEGKRDVFC